MYNRNEIISLSTFSVSYLLCLIHLLSISVAFLATEGNVPPFLPPNPEKN